MALNIKTFANQKPCSFFKALGHPKILSNLNKLKQQLEKLPRLSVYDPQGLIEDFLALTQLDVPIDLYTQAVETFDKSYAGVSPRPITDLPQSKPSLLLLLSFDENPYIEHIRHLLPSPCEVLSLKSCKLPETLVADHRHYLSDLNFATNFAFFREEDGWHTRLVTANYWQKYGAEQIKILFMLFDQQGILLTEWIEEFAPKAQTICIDSKEVRARFNLSSFTGQLFMHVVGAKGHSIVKYALDTYHDDGTISATHDANAWPSLYCAGLPAPNPQERVILWLQNNHSLTIPAHEIAFNIMGEPNQVTYPQPFKPFETKAIDVQELFPHALWPQQIEIETGHYFVRPRYEVINAQGYRCIAHINVERIDLKPDPKLATLNDYLGKGFILSAPILPMGEYITSLLPTPMTRDQKYLPIKALAYDKDGKLKTSYSFGNLPRKHAHSLTLNDLLDLKQEYGHVELVYDFDVGDEADGWLHALFRYKHKHMASQAETSFGSHIFNSVLTYKNEPQSYKGPPPGLSTGLYLRLGASEVETFCHLIYPVSLEWHAVSDTKLLLCNSQGEVIAESHLKIPASGSRLWFYRELFNESDRKQAKDGYIFIQDKICRLFGYHGLRHKTGAFSLDHMFGF